MAEIGAAICSETRQVVPYDNARVHVLADDGVTLEAIAFSHHSPEYADEDCRIPKLQVGAGITGWVVQHGHGLIVPDASRDPRAVPVPGTPLIQEQMLLVPLRYEGMARGAIVLSRVGGGSSFNGDDLRLVQVLADQAAVALENARTLASRDRVVQELEALLEISRAGSTEHDEAGLAVPRGGHPGPHVGCRCVCRLALGRAICHARDAQLGRSARLRTHGQG